MGWNFFVEALFRSTLVLLAGELLLKWSSRQSAAFRHRLITGTFTFIALLPVLCAVLPSISLPGLYSESVGRVSVVVHQVSSRPPIAATTHRIAWPGLVWFLGFAVTSFPGLVGAFSVFRVTRSSRIFRTEALKEALARAGLAGTVPPILLSDEISVPLTCGVFRPRIILPGEAAGWSVFRLHAVLAHEFSHIRRHDVFVQVFVHLVCALWWFQPLAWVFRQSLRRESELACDADAISTGLKPSVYAGELLAVAKSLAGDIELSSLAIGMARTKSLEARICAVLAPSAIAPGLATQWMLITFLAAFAAGASAFTVGSSFPFINQGESTMKKTLLSALLTSASLSAATVTGSVSSPAGDAIPDAKVVVYNPDTGAKQEATTASDGTFSLAGAGAGQYILRVEKPGFNSTFRMFDLKADSNVNRQIVLAAPGTEPLPEDVTSSAGSEPKPLRVKGTVAENNLTTKVQPTYPVAAKSARVQGTVELEIKVTKDGVPSELRVVRSPSDDLSESALEAVRQWRYRPTLLNGSPVEIVSTVIVNYTLSR